MILATALTCLAFNVYMESRGEIHQDQLAITEVAWKRADRNADKVCNVINAPGQYPYAKTAFRKRGKQFYLVSKPQDSAAWKASLAVAKYSFTHRTNVTKGANFFHGAGEHPAWAKKAKFLTKVGGHWYYYLKT